MSAIWMPIPRVQGQPADDGCTGFTACPTTCPVWCQDACTNCETDCDLQESCTISDCEEYELHPPCCGPDDSCDSFPPHTNCCSSTGTPNCADTLIELTDISGTSTKKYKDYAVGL